MVRLHVKRGDESQFLFDTTVTSKTDEVIGDVAGIYNGRLKVERICYGKIGNLCRKMSNTEGTL
jgi:hypothetical protein